MEKGVGSRVRARERGEACGIESEGKGERRRAWNVKGGRRRGGNGMRIG